MEFNDIILYPFITEKVQMKVETENKLAFIVIRAATKRSIKRVIEETYEVKVAKVDTTILSDGRKKAFVRLHPDFPALDVATRLGVL